MSKHQRFGSERGSALLVSMMMLVALAVMAAMFAMQSGTEFQLSGHNQRHTQSLYCAEAGLSEAMLRMRSNADSTINAVNGIWETQPGWGRYLVSQTGASLQDPDVTDTANDGLDNDGDGTIDETNERYPEVASVQSSTDLTYPWVKVRYRVNGAGQAILYGDHDSDPTTAPQPNLTVGAPIIVMTAVGARGTATRSVEVEAVKAPFDMVHAAVYSETDNYQFNGTQFLISGKDWDPDIGIPIAGAPEVPGIATTGDPSNIIGALNAQQMNNVEGIGGEPSVGTSPLDMDLQAMADQYSAIADNTLPGGTYSNESWGTKTDPEVVHFTGDLNASGLGGGSGILIVNGDFDCTGQWEWHGLMIVLGDIKFSGGGSGFHLYGSLLAQGSIDTQAIGGNADMAYSTKALSRLLGLLDYTVVSWREL